MDNRVGQKQGLAVGWRLMAGVGRLVLCAAVFVVLFGAWGWADNPNPDWVLVFKDEFSTSSFEGKK